MIFGQVAVYRERTVKKVVKVEVPLLTRWTRLEGPWYLIQRLRFIVASCLSKVINLILFEARNECSLVLIVGQFRDKFVYSLRVGQLDDVDLFRNGTRSRGKRT